LVEKRADIWSFGVVLWEMLCGKALFSGETISHTLAAVLTTDPAWERLPAGTPASIGKLLRRCLERDRKKRLRDIGDALVEIDEALVGAPAKEAAALARPSRSVLPWVVAAVFAVAALALGMLHFREAPPEQRVMKLFVPPPEKSTFGSIVISPDGRRLAFSATESGKAQLWVRSLDALTAQPLASIAGRSAPFWSPDSRYIGFFADGKLKKI